MKRILALILASLMLLSLAACGNTEDKKPADDNNVTSDEVIGEEQPIAADIDPLDLLNNVWASYAEDDKFPAANLETMEGAGRMPEDYNNAETVDNFLALPADCFDKVTDIACLMHMMNANTFTCGAYSVNDADVDAVAKGIKDNIMAREWMCGFPDIMFVARVNNCMVSCFGNEEIVTKFKENLKATYPETEYLYEENIL